MSFNNVHIINGCVYIYTIDFKVGYMTVYYFRAWPFVVQLCQVASRITSVIKTISLSTHKIPSMLTAPSNHVGWYRCQIRNHQLSIIEVNYLIVMSDQLLCPSSSWGSLFLDTARRLLGFFEFGISIIGINASSY